MLLQCDLHFSQARGGFPRLGGRKKQTHAKEMLLWPGVFCQMEILKVFSLRSPAVSGNALLLIEEIDCDLRAKIFRAEMIW